MNDDKKEPREIAVLANSCPDCGDKSLIRYDKENDQIYTTDFVPTKEGEPLEPGAELVKLHRSKGALIEIEKVCRVPGPSRHATPAYRSNYDRIFKKHEAN